MVILMLYYYTQYKYQVVIISHLSLPLTLSTTSRTKSNSPVYSSPSLLPVLHQYSALLHCGAE